ncbi:PilZ domain-containing protein [Bdellovibrionota bacterium FG-1]
MNRNKPQLAVISKNETSRNFFSSQIDIAGASSRTFANLLDFKRNSGVDQFSGVVIDFKSILSSEAAEKAFLADVEGSFPLLRIIHCEPGVKVSGIVEDLNLEGADIFERFIQDRCRPFLARGVRMHRRLIVHLNVVLQGMNNESVLTNTYNISPEGLFIIDSRNHPVGNIIRFTVQEFTDLTPIEAEVRWNLKWGVTSGHLPGIGVQFRSISQAQKAQLLSRIL